MTDVNQTSVQLLPRRYSDPQPEFTGHYRIAAEHRWLLTGSKEALNAAEAALTGVSERVSGEVLLLEFGNAVGFFDIPGLGFIEVVSGKLNRNGFDQMLAELTDIASALPFAAATTAALPYDRSVATEKTILYHMFVYLRHALSNASASNGLVPALKHIIRDPHRHFVQTRHQVTIDRVHHLDPVAVTNIASGKGTFSRVFTGSGRGNAIVQVLRGHLPDTVDVGQIQNTTDTAENRFMKAFLGSMAGVIDEMRVTARSAGPDVFTTRVANECEQLGTLLGPIIRQPLWRDVGPMIHLPASSPVLQRRRGYREAYRHFIKMRLAARVPLRASLMHDLLEAKDVALLYEVWSYFVVVRELTALLGTPEHAQGPHIDRVQLTIRWEIECRWPGGVRLLYNPRFSRGHPHQPSFSVPLRPDVALEVKSGPNAGIHLFDAKFKVDQIGKDMAFEDVIDSPRAIEPEERRGVFTHADLYKMHAYRDAILPARSVWIVYPGTEPRFFSAGDGAITTFGTLPASLDGVGAIPVRPGSTNSNDLRAVLARLVDVELVPGESVG